MLDWLLSGLATYYLLMVWLHSPLPFHWMRLTRARCEAARDAGYRWGELVTCPTCLSFYLGPTVYLTYNAHPVGSYLVIAMAVPGVAVALIRATVYTLRE